MEVQPVTCLLTPAFDGTEYCGLQLPPTPRRVPAALQARPAAPPPPPGPAMNWPSSAPAPPA